MEDTFVYILVLRRLIAIAPYAHFALNTVKEEVLNNRASRLKRVGMGILFMFVALPLVAMFESGLIIWKVIGFMDWCIEGALGFLITAFTIGAPMALHQRWAVEVFMLCLERVFGRLWQRSVVRLKVTGLKCEHDTGCTLHQCYTLRRGALQTTMKITCSCMRASVLRRLTFSERTEVAGGIHQADEDFIERAGVLGASELEAAVNGGCCQLRGELHKPRYDMNRLMWIETQVRDVPRDDRGRPREDRGQVEYTRGRSGLDEMLSVAISLDDLMEASHLHLEKLVYSDQVARGYLKVVRCPAISFGKAAVVAVTVAMAISAVVEETKAGRVAAMVILLAFISGAIGSVASSLDLQEAGLALPRALRTLAIDHVSSGRPEQLVSGQGTCWAARPTNGDIQVGPVSWIENLVINRTVSCPTKAVSLSRRGVLPLVADVMGAQSPLHASGWEAVVSQKADNVLDGFEGRCLTLAMGAEGDLRLPSRTEVRIGTSSPEMVGTRYLTP